MLGRKAFTQEELDAAREAVASPHTYNELLLALDRRFVHRVRMVSGKDSNPLNEVELLVESLMNNDGMLRVGTVIKYVPEETVLGLSEGDRIDLDAEQFEKLSKAFLAEIEAKFLS
jgi:hypothetical protein